MVVPTRERKEKRDNKSKEVRDLYFDLHVEAAAAAAAAAVRKRERDQDGEKTDKGGERHFFLEGRQFFFCAVEPFAGLLDCWTAVLLS